MAAADSMTTAIERRLAGIEAAVDALAPKPSALEEFTAANPWFEWTSCDELDELEQIYRAAEEAGAMTEADAAKVMAIMYASKARMLAGEPKDVDLPPQPYDVQAAYAKAKRAAEPKGR
jgi:hypothetical protein